MINLNANKQLKNLGCTWENGEWKAPELAADEAQAIKDYYYTDLITIQVTVIDRLREERFGYSEARTVGGYVVASATGRDAGARIADGVAFIRGKASSGGSVKNYSCILSDDAVIRLKVSKNALVDLDKEVEEGRYTYEILEQKQTRAELLEKRNQLEIELKKINSMIEKIESI